MYVSSLLRHSFVILGAKYAPACKGATRSHFCYKIHTRRFNASKRGKTTWQRQTNWVAMQRDLAS